MAAIVLAAAGARDGSRAAANAAGTSAIETAEVGVLAVEDGKRRSSFERWMLDAAASDAYTVATVGTAPTVFELTATFVRRLSPPSPPTRGRWLQAWPAASRAPSGSRLARCSAVAMSPAR